MLSSDIFMLTNVRLTLVQWQRAIDRQRFPIALRLDPAQPRSSAGLWYARLDDRAVQFRLEEVRRTDIAAEDLTSVIARWRYAFALPGTGDIGPVAAGMAALLAYAVATGGVFHGRDGERLTDFVGMRPLLDTMLALGAGKPELVAQGRATEPDLRAAMSIVTRRAQ